MTISTGKTNALGYELYSVVAEVNGQGIPVAFIFTTSDGTAEEGAKERMLQDLLEYLKKRCPNIMFTLSDKELSEINAFQVKLLQAKHQLCYWHAIRYIEERLGEN
jgi:MULE transposase domain.